MDEPNILKPGETPKFPPNLGEVANNGAIAEAAWKQSGGSITAFEQLCAEHVRGEINLTGEKRDEGEKKPPPPPPAARPTSAAAPAAAARPAAPAPGAAART